MLLWQCYLCSSGAICYLHDLTVLCKLSPRFKNSTVLDADLQEKLHKQKMFGLRCFENVGKTLQQIGRRCIFNAS